MKHLTRFFALVLALTLALSLSLPAFALGAQRPDPEKPFDNSAFFDYKDYRIHYRTFPAENEKGQIFMIHGFALSSYCFVMLAEKLVEAGYTCVLADLPDFGYSTRETKDTVQLPRDEIMHALMQDLSDKPWFVAGHSMGGYVALGVAQSYPGSVKNLLLYGTNGNDGAGGAPAKLMANDTFVSTVGPLMELMGKSKPLVRLLYIFACNSFSFAMHYDVSKITDPYYIKGTGAGAIRNFSMLPPTDYAAVKTMPPILFLNGDKDFVITDSTRKNLRAALPDGSVDYVVKGAGHMVIETHAAETAQVTVDFLAGK